MYVNRRQLLIAGGGLGAATLVGCSSRGGGAPAPQSTGGSPKRGGTLRVGALGRAGAITRDPHGTQSNESDYLVLSLVFDTLTVPAGKPNTAPRLAASWEAGPDLRTWRFKIAPGALFHDGGPVTAADVVWSLRRLRNTKSGASRLPGVQADNITADGDGTVVLVSDYPNAELPLLTRLSSFVLKKDTPDNALDKAPGTGPFKLDWYRNGNARLVRNEKWYGGEVLLDAVEITMFETAQAMSNAILAGQIDLASNVGPVAARTAETRKDLRVVRRADDMAMPIVMRAKDGPFADPRVREALRLVVDRDAMVKQVLSGYGTVANDIMGTGDPRYARDIPQRVRNLARAGQLLTEANFDLGKTYDLITTEDIAGLAESATLFANHAREAGIRINVVKQESGKFWDETWQKGTLYTTYWGTNDSVLFLGSKLMVGDAGQNEARFADPAFDDAYRRAVGAADEAGRAAALVEVQKIQHERSGYLLWGMADGIDVATAKVQGLPTLAGYGRVQLQSTWLR
ncbi:ABC transporter substrate-binding protein [Embleya scabrispora]|uniref:ABC transporter substrate-binding protein n=1 Tax=Embleya scabrispora TaxID=159449 RepID=UPI00036F9E08|nr:ABC transporter substrate-binding protein [Embleya scabrispora]MYS80506.1 ABC transporter substrate-binding protein [Streptomyces sp. SID5474]